MTCLYKERRTFDSSGPHGKELRVFLFIKNVSINLKLNFITNLLLKQLQKIKLYTIFQI